MKKGEYRTCGIESGSLYVPFMDVESGDYVYLYESKTVMQLMTKDQYNAFLSDCYKKIKAALTPEEKRRMELLKQCVKDSKCIKVFKGKTISIGKYKSKYRLNDIVGVQCVEFGFRLWNPESYGLFYNKRFPHFSRGMFVGEACRLYFRDDGINFVYSFRIKSVINVSDGDDIYLILRDGYLEVRTEKLWNDFVLKHSTGESCLDHGSDLVDDDILAINFRKVKVRVTGDINIPKAFVDACGLENPIVVKMCKDCVMVMSSSTYELEKGSGLVELPIRRYR